MTSTLVIGRALTDLGGVDPSHRAIHITDGLITWTGADPREAPDADQVLDLGEAWLTPGFVDAHVHGTATGLQLTGLDLSAVEDRRGVLVKLARHAVTTGSEILMGSGWDDSRWDIPGPPTADEVAAAAPGRSVVLVRADGHSCVVDAHTLASLDLSGIDPDHIHTDGAGRRTGWLKEEASARAIASIRSRIPDADLQQARTTMAARARDLGILTVHEMGLPALSDIDDARIWRDGTWPVHVHVYWADIAVDPAGEFLPGGDLFLDGSIGSCTAATRQPYTCDELSQTTGALLNTDQDVQALIRRGTRAGVGVGFHAIGDAAIQQAVAAFQAVAATEGEQAVVSARHRLEHVELATPEHAVALARLGVYASVQPAFDAVWNGPGGLYETRFGRGWADTTNPLRLMRDAGVPLCFSSDAPVTPLDPWGGVLAAEAHHGGQSLTRREALHAATIGGHEVLGHEDQVGALTVGRRADVVAWPGDPLTGDPRGWEPVHSFLG